MRRLHWLAVPCSIVLVWAMTLAPTGVVVALAQTTCGGWRVVSSPDPGSAVNDLYGVSAVSSKDVWTVGEYGPPGGGADTLTEHWNGSQWTVIPSPNAGEGNYLYSVSAISSTDAWAVGYTSPSSGGTYTLIKHWDGVQWQRVPSPSPGAFANILDGGGVFADPLNSVHADGTLEWQTVEGGVESQSGTKPPIAGCGRGARHEPGVVCGFLHQ